MHIERIHRDPTVFLSIVPKLRQFFFKCVVPEILCIQNDPKSDNECEDEMEDGNEVYCFCRQQASGIMIACDNKECPYEWIVWG